MKIDTYENGLKKPDEANFSEIINTIFAICKTDPSFPLKDQFEKYTNGVEELKTRYNKQTELLKKSNIMNAEIQKKIESLNEANLKVKRKLLEALGSEL